MISAPPITLVRDTPPIVRRACAQTQLHTRIRVVCPRLTPRTSYTHIRGLSGPLTAEPTLWAVTFNNGGPFGDVHWIAGRGRRATVRTEMLGDRQNEVKGLPRRLATRHVHGRTVTDYRYPTYPAGGPNGSHVAAYVDCGRDFVFASIHGDDVAAAEAMALDLARISGCR